MKQPGMDLTTIFGATYREEFVIRVKYCNNISYDDLMSTGRGKAYYQIRLFEKTLKDWVDNTHRSFMREVMDLYPNIDRPTF